MSVFGVILLLAFLAIIGGLVALEYSGNSDLALSKVLLVLLRLLIVAEACIALYEFPCYVVDGIVFISMGKDFLAKIMFAIVGGIVLFILGVILPRIKWKKHLEATQGRIIALGIVLLCLFGYNEIFNGAYSFDSMEEFNSVKQSYSEFDNHFWPTKYIKHHSSMNDQDEIGVYPFDMTLLDGTKVKIYKGETFRVDNADGTYELFYYPFTWKLYEGSNAESIGVVGELPEPPVSAADVPSQTDIAPVEDLPEEQAQPEE